MLDLLGDWGFADVRVVHPYLDWAVAGVGLSAAVAALSYYLVERPALSLKRLVGRRDPSPPGEALTEPAPAVAPRAG
jgi:peptidoglycan/LPS O-acetylase OafA/YrhL